MKKLRLNIDGKEVTGLLGQTILEVAEENGIFIPTLCFDERTEIYGACGLCVCEIEGNPRQVKACATEIADNMIIRTDTKRVKESRKTALELLLSNHTGDCRPPCMMNCPAGTDCQGYAGLIANGEYRAAAELIKDRIPLPASLGRVCPHPCESKCRRKLVEEPISIQLLKRFAADRDILSGSPFMPDMEEDTGKSVGIIGGGPMGLSAAYFLRRMGHKVTIMDSMPKLGGMLRYGIPEYRLPNEVLDAEIALIGNMGVTFVTDTKIGVDIPFENVRSDFDAVLIAIGAWVSTGVGCKGEDADGIIGGIDFLRKVVRNEEIKLGSRVAVVGGGNTAMDAARTAVRLGVDKVYNIYRRTRDEMPADMIEIIEAEEEGVIFMNLTNPLEITADEKGHVKQVILQVMELGDPDESGRRAPVPVAGKTETLDIDNMILAIGQAVESSAFDFDKTRKGSVMYDPKTFMTSLPGVFAGGDCGNDKISVAVEAVADAGKAAQMIDMYLNGEDVGYEKPFFVTRDDITEKTFEDRERMCRTAPAHLTPEERRDCFTEIVFGYTEEQATREAGRCLECGCGDYFECKLIEYANEYDVKPGRFAGDKNDIEPDDSHPFIVRDPNKCVVCGLCVRVCEEIVGTGALGFVNRGFDTAVKPALEKPLAESGCISCGQCAGVCPTGALQEKSRLRKPVPLETEVTGTICSYCSVGCGIDVETYGNMLIKANPDKYGAVNKGLLCGRGKFGFDSPLLEGGLTEPMIKNADGFRSAGYREALRLTAEKVRAVSEKYGKEGVAVAISDRYTNEEASMMKKLADAVGAKAFCFNNRANGIKPVLGFDASPNTIDELFSTELIIAAGFEAASAPVLAIKIRQAAKNGVRVIHINPEKNDNSFLRGMAKALLDMGKSSDITGFTEFSKSVSKAVVTDEVKAVAEAYAKAKKAMFVCEQNFVTSETASLIGDIALLSGHIGSPGDGILLIKPKNNSQGLVDLGITAGAEALAGAKGLLIFGEDPNIELPDLEFLMVSDTHMTKTAAKADVIIPGTSFLSSDGTFTNTERRRQMTSVVIVEDVPMNNAEIAAGLAEVFGAELVQEDTYEEIGEIRGGTLKPENPAFVPVPEGAFVDRLDSTDNLMNVSKRRLPNP